MAYLPKDERRAAIVAATAHIIEQQGLGAATVRAVAQALDASPGQIHHHFASADDLRAEAFRMLWQNWLVDFRQQTLALPGLVRAIALVSGLEQQSPTDVTERLCSDAIEASKMSAPIRAALAEAMKGWIALVTEALDAAKIEGTLPAATDAGAVAATLIMLVTGSDVLRGVGILGADLRAVVTAQIDLVIAAG